MHQADPNFFRGYVNDVSFSLSNYLLRLLFDHEIRACYVRYRRGESRHGTPGYGTEEKR